MSPVSEARKRANEKYTKANYDEIKVRVPKGKKKIIQQCAMNAGESTTAFINRAIDERIERENPLPEAPAAAPSKTFEERREQLLKEYETLASAAGQEMSGSPAGFRHRQQESDPVTSPLETLDEKLERLRKEHSAQAPIGSNE